jgi:hypothetical protein
MAVTPDSLSGVQRLLVDVRYRCFYIARAASGLPQRLQRSAAYAKERMAESRIKNEEIGEAGERRVDHPDTKEVSSSI